MRKRINKQAKEFAIEAGSIAELRNCTDVMILDLRGLSPASDYFVIATGTSNRQMKTVCDEISQLARKKSMERFGRAGYEQASWILLDFVDVVVHIFSEQYREFYDLELLWGDAKKVKIPKPETDKK